MLYVKVVNLDALTYAGDLSNVSELQGNPRYTFIHGDICDREFVETLFNKYQFSAVIHFAGRIARRQLYHKSRRICENKCFWDL
jgi:dTDP-D-glucose 4,6-dehydratase